MPLIVSRRKPLLVQSTRLFPMRLKTCKGHQIEELVAFQFFDFNKQVLRLGYCLLLPLHALASTSLQEGVPGIGDSRLRSSNNQCSYFFYCTTFLNKAAQQLFFLLRSIFVKFFYFNFYFGIVLILINIFLFLPL